MKVQRQSSDRISSLPQDIIGKILSLMPIRDAVTTSILSKKWRYCWSTMPKLVLDDNMVNEYSGHQDVDRSMLAAAAVHVVFLHSGPILELSICLCGLDIRQEIDQIILHLSRTNTIKKFIYDDICSDNEFISFYKLPCSFFSLQVLEHLDLTCCVFELPSKFNGLSLLKSLRLNNVEITDKMLQRFLTNCPLLEEFTLIGRQEEKNFAGGNKCTFVKLFKVLPSVQVLNISWYYIKYFAAGGMPQKLSASLAHLRILLLDVCFQKQYELSSLLCVIRISPNLEKIKLTMIRTDEETSDNLLDLQDYSGLKLDRLKELAITSFHNNVYEMEFLKLIVVKSPVLEKVQIELSNEVSIDEENKMLRVLLRAPFLRASPAAIFINERPKKA